MTPDSTEKLIARLAAEAQPVRRLSGPGLRATIWLAVAVALLGVIALQHGLRSDMMRQLADPMFVIGRIAALLTGITACYAAFALSLPDRSGRWALLPLPFAAVWIASMGGDCLIDWLTSAPPGDAEHSGHCLEAILTSSLPLGLLLFWMVRHAGPVRPLPTAVIGGLAVGALSEVGLALYHDMQASIFDIGVHAVAVLIVVAIASGAGKRLFALMGPRKPLQA